MNQKNVEALAQALEESVPGGLIPGGFYEVARELAARGVLVSGQSTTVADPAFHQPSYDAGFRDGNEDIKADYCFALEELVGDFEWPKDRGYDPTDVAAVVKTLADQIREREWRDQDNRARDLES